MAVFCFRDSAGFGHVSHSIQITRMRDLEKAHDLGVNVIEILLKTVTFLKLKIHQGTLFTNAQE